MSIPFELRPATMYDKTFMMKLEKVTWDKYLELNPGTDIELDEELQKEHYEYHFRPKYVSIIEHKGAPIGAYSVLFKRKGIFIVYLYVLPEYNNGGIKELLIKEVQKRAKEERKPINTCVYKGVNMDKDVCVSLGFKQFREDGIKLRMKWEPP